MDEKPALQTPTSTHTTINHADAKPAAGNGAMWFILGAIVVAVAVVAYFVFGSGALTTSGSTTPAGGNVSVNVDSSTPPATEAAPTAETAPAQAAPAETAPAVAPPAD